MWAVRGILDGPALEYGLIYGCIRKNRIKNTNNTKSDVTHHIIIAFVSCLSSQELKAAYVVPSPPFIFTTIL